MINLYFKLFLKSLGETIVLIAAMALAGLAFFGMVWLVVNATGFALTAIMLGIIGGLTYHQYKEKASKLKYIEKRLEEAKQEIFRLEDKIITMSDEADVNEMDLQYWNNMLKDARDTFNYLIQEKRELWRWNV